MGGFPVDKLVKSVVLVSTRQIHPLTLRANDVVSGSGFFIDSRRVITCAHVVGSHSKVRIYHCGREVVGIVRKVKQDLDLALIETLFYDSKFSIKVDYQVSVKVGEEVYAIGYPLGVIGLSNLSELKPAVTKGIVSRDSVEVELPNGLKIKAIQIDTPVNPGNSGGPLVNTRGRVVGVVNAGIPLAQNIGFAIPAKYIEKLLLRTRRYGISEISVSRKASNIVIISRETARMHGVECKGNIAIVNEEDELTEGAGLKVGDIIIEIDGKPIHLLGDVINAIKSGERLKVIRNGKTLII